MKHIVPDYYLNFKCIASECRHSCCIGWEIDIDDETYCRYKAVKGDFGKRLCENIAESDGTHIFRLGADERCPFLNKCGLCDIIINMGEDALCGICAEHPRFHNSRCDERLESGIGLCCEAAAEIILSKRDTVKFVVLDEDDESGMSDEDTAFFDERNRLIAIAQDRGLPIKQRIHKLCKSAERELPDYSFAEWTSILLSLERLDSTWDDVLDRAAKNERMHEIDGIQFEQLLVYFLYRHLSSAEDDYEMSLYTLFAVISSQIICEIAARTDLPITEAARMYSSEVEYSEDNTSALLDVIDENTSMIVM